MRCSMSKTGIIAGVAAVAALVAQVVIPATLDMIMGVVMIGAAGYGGFMLGKGDKGE